MRRSTSGLRRKVEEARRVVQQALGAAARREVGPQVAKFSSTTKPPEPIQVEDESVLVLTIGEAATRLRISTSEMDAMVKHGTVKSVVAGLTTMVPTSEVERLPQVRR
jgi:hypothetical protein